MSGILEDGISLRGHRDDSTSENVNQISCVVLGHSVLNEHLKTGAKNAQYTSKTAQNDLLTCMKEYMQEEIIKHIVRQSS